MKGTSDERYSESTPELPRLFLFFRHQRKQFSWNESPRGRVSPQITAQTEKKRIRYIGKGSEHKKEHIKTSENEEKRK